MKWDKYECDPERDRLGKKRIEDTNHHVLELVVIISKPRRPEDRFVETVDPETGERAMKRTVKGKDGKTDEDSRQSGQKRTTRKEVGPMVRSATVEQHELGIRMTNSTNTTSTLSRKRTRRSKQRIITK